MSIEVIITSLVSVGLGMVIGNYAFQFFNTQDYWLAFERSFFQGAAIVVAGAMLTIRWWAGA